MSTGIYLPREIETVDMREDYIPRMDLAINRVIHYREMYPNIKNVIISRTQRTTLIYNTPELKAGAEQMAAQFEKPIEDLEMQIIIERCHVIVE